jgi:uncharacterized membrane protein
MHDGKPNCYFDLEMRPNRSLDRRHFWWMLVGVAAVFGLMALRFLVLGAWPILPFLFADIGLLWWAMRASYRSGIEWERLRLDRRGLELIRRTPTGRFSAIRLEAGRTRVELEQLALDQNRLWLDTGGKRHAIGRFLSPPERVEVAAVIADGLRRFHAG